MAGHGARGGGRRCAAGAVDPRAQRHDKVNRLLQSHSCIDLVDQVTGSVLLLISTAVISLLGLN